MSEEILGTEAVETTAETVSENAETVEEAVEKEEDTVSETGAGSENGGDPPKKKKRGRKHIHEVTEENDIRFRGPLSYRYFKLFGWICIVISQMQVVMNIRVVTVQADPGAFLGNTTLISLITSLSLPFLLISNFAILLNGHNRYPRLLLTNGAIAGGFIAFYLLVYYHYILHVAEPFFGGKLEADAGLNQLLIQDETFNGYFAFNIFLDMFLCALLLFFADYRPKKFFKGKMIYLFRSFAVLPVLYEAASVTLKILASNHIVNLPIAAYPFLTTKPPMCFVMFVIMVVYIKRREAIFRKNGKTHEDFRNFCKTNTNSWQFSKYFVFIIISCTIIDFFIAIIVVLLHAGNTGVSLDDLGSVVPTVVQWGFGESYSMIFLVPFMLLFSYTRTHKKPIIDTIIPLAGVIAIVLIYVDGIFQLLNGFAEIMNKELLTEYADTLSGFLR